MQFYWLLYKSVRGCQLMLGKFLQSLHKNTFTVLTKIPSNVALDALILYQVGSAALVACCEAVFNACHVRVCEKDTLPSLCSVGMILVMPLYW